MKKILTESQLNAIVADATRRVLNEMFSQSAMRNSLISDIYSALEDADDLSGVAIVKSPDGYLTAEPVYQGDNGPTSGNEVIEIVPIEELDDEGVENVADGYFDLRLG